MAENAVSGGLCGRLLMSPVLWILSDMPAEEKLTIEIPYGYTQRDQLLQFLKSKLPRVEISLIHSEVDKPQVCETLVEHDSSTQSATAEPAQGEDAKTVMDEVEEALSQFASSANHRTAEEGRVRS